MAVRTYAGGIATLQTSLNSRVLVLNQSYEPISVCSTRKALLLLLLAKAELVENHEALFIHSVSRQLPFPSVIRLGHYLRIPYRKIELSRKNIIRRDEFTCQYCGAHHHSLTIDHIIPRSRGGADTWENLVCACMKCNNKKGNRTPDEAGMRLNTIPKKPHHVQFLRHYLGTIDDNWKPYLFMD